MKIHMSKLQICLAVRCKGSLKWNVELNLHLQKCISLIIYGDILESKQIQ